MPDNTNDINDLPDDSDVDMDALKRKAHSQDIATRGTGRPVVRQDYTGQDPTDRIYGGEIAPKLAGERSKAQAVVSRIRSFIEKYSDKAQDRFGAQRVEGVTFSAQVKEALAYPLKGAMEDRAVRIPDDAKIRADLRKVQKVTTAAGNVRFVAESTPDGHADRFWALALAIHAASDPSAPIDYQSSGPRESVTEAEGFLYG